MNVLLTKKGWEDVHQAWEDERDRVTDDAEMCVREMITQREDLVVASASARWYLGRRGKDRGFADESRVTVEGGDKPIKIEQAIL